MMNIIALKRTVERLGEELTFESGITVKAALKYSTSAVFNLSNRAYYVEGQAVRGEPMYNVGDYFVRNRFASGKQYFVTTIQPDDLTEDLVYLFATQCNAEIVVKRYIGKEANEDGDLTDKWETVCENAPVYRDVTTRSDKQTNDGRLDQGIYTMIAPHRYFISEGDRVYFKCNNGGKYEDTEFYVENVNSALADDGITGIDSMQLSMDLRER